MVRKLVLGVFFFTAPVIPVALLVLYLWDVFTPVQVMWMFSALLVVYSAVTGPAMREFYDSKNITTDEQIFWTMVPEIIAWPVIYFKIIYNRQPEPQKGPPAEEPAKPAIPLAHAVSAFFCFMIPFYLLTNLFGLGAYWQLFGVGTKGLNYFVLGGFCYVLVVFWRSRRFTTDDKLFWTVAILFSVGLGLPLLYMKKLRTAELPEDA